MERRRLSLLRTMQRFILIPGVWMKNADLVVVTSVWSLFFFDHNLKKLWETNQQYFPHNAHHREIATSINNYT
ncbi:unnamed protein product [Brassica rapa subsp. narinosa]